MNFYATYTKVAEGCQYKIKDEIVTIDENKDITEWVCRGLRNLVFERTGVNEESFSKVFAAKKDGAYLGALIAETSWNIMAIRYLYVDPLYRKQGLGTSLIQSAIEFALKQGYSSIVVETMSFYDYQFYLEMGFYLEFKREGYTNGVSQYYLCKSL